DSGGPGRFRGGLAARLDFEVFQPDSILTARGMDRFVFQPWGLNGGRPGAKGDAWLNPGTPQATRLGKITMLRLNLGEILSIRSPTGGGFGDPLQRRPESVPADGRSGYVTATSAREDYGVIVANGEVDATATAALRKEMRAARAAAPR